MTTIQNEVVIDTLSPSHHHATISMESNSRSNVAETTEDSQNQENIQCEENNAYPSHSSQHNMHDEENQISSSTSTSGGEEPISTNTITEAEIGTPNEESEISSYSSEGIKQIAFTLIQDHSRQNQLGRRLLHVKRSGMLIVALAVIFVNFYILLHGRWN